MYRKALVFSDFHIAAQILVEPEPGNQKALGRKVKGFDGKKWDKVKSDIVEEGNWWKFSSTKGENLRKKLLETGQRELVEVSYAGLDEVVDRVGGDGKLMGGQASPYDRIWGVGFAAANAEERRAEWGENLLGKALMRVRERLREEGEKQGERS